MLQNKDHMEVSFIFYVKVSKFNQLEQNKICIVTITTLGIAMQTIYHDMIVSISCKYDHRDVLRYTSPDVRSIDECPLSIIQT